MAKKKRKTSKKRGKRRTSSSRLNSVATSALEAELRRRQRGLDSLIAKRDKLAAQVADLDSQIRELGGSVAGAVGRPRGSGRRGGGPRARNSMTLVDAMQKALRNKTLSVTEIAEVVQEQGYKTTSPNFRTIVNQALINNKKTFKKVSRGKYTAA